VKTNSLSLGLEELSSLHETAVPKGLFKALYSERERVFFSLMTAFLSIIGHFF